MEGKNGTYGHIVAGSVFLVVPFIALLCYTIVAIAIYKIWKDSRNNFYILLLALALTDSVQLCLYMLYAGPATLLQSPPFGPEVDALLFGTLNNFSYFAGLALLLNIGINRYWAVCRNKAYVAIYDKRTIIASIGACYAFGALSAAPQLAPCCPLRFYETEYSFGYDMDTNAPYVWYDRAISIGIFLSCTVIYSYMICYVTKVKSRVVPRGHSMVEERLYQTNKRLAIQSGIVFSLVLACGLTFTIIPPLTDNKWIRFGAALVAISSFGIQPVVYLVFNRRVRHVILQLIATWVVS